LRSEFRKKCCRQCSTYSTDPPIKERRKRKIDLESQIAAVLKQQCRTQQNPMWKRKIDLESQIAAVLKQQCRTQQNPVWKREEI